MAAIVAVNHRGRHFALSPRVLNLSHARPLPRVFLRIGKEDVSSCDIESSIVIISLLMRVFREMLAKHSFAIIRPEVKVQYL